MSERHITARVVSWIIRTIPETCHGISRSSSSSHSTHDEEPSISILSRFAPSVGKRSSLLMHVTR